MEFIKKDELNVTDFNLDGFLKISELHIAEKQTTLFLQKNELACKVLWWLSIDLTVGSIELHAIYEPVSKLDFSKLATFKANQKFHFSGMSDTKNKDTVIKKIIEEFNGELKLEYNARIKGTKVEIPFPTPTKQTVPQFQKYVLSSLDSAIQKVRNFRGY